jgi:alkyldihydroxyacetonephosphate synthase
VTEPRRDSNWSGWGDPTRRTELDATALGVLRERIGELEPWPPAAQIDDFDLPEARPLPRAVIDAVGADAVFDGKEDRLRHAVGRGYVDLARLRSGRLDDAPDAVLVPADAAAVGRLIDACAAHDVAVVPFGGGTSVVGGVEPLRGSHAGLISLDLAALREVVLDDTSLTARLGAGLRGPEAEAALAAQSLTLGHFPQSFEYATIGGFAATRSAGRPPAATGASTRWSARCGCCRPPGTWPRSRPRTPPPARPCARW